MASTLNQRPVASASSSSPLSRALVRATFTINTKITTQRTKVPLNSCQALGGLMVSGVVLTYSRGGFIGLLVALTFFAWKAGQRRRLEIVVVGFLIVAAFLALVPGYALRLASILIPSLDPVGSSEARSGELFRSLYVAIRHPLLGIGMGNYAPEMSYRGLVTHNSYTQVAAEMGMA